ncbi:MAG: diaminopimelate epimerase [Clostridiales bacterium]|nr:diaminopimelate epimerase [Clostridiales bacterium]
MTFTKMQGIGNDYIYIDCLNGCPSNLASLSREMSDRHTGVGGDGIILIEPSGVADFKMRIFNADGTEARMCGNGSRCVSKYVYDNNLTDKLNITLETLSGVKHLFLKPGNNSLVSEVTVDMGLPSFLTKEIPVSCSSDTFINQPIDDVSGESLKLTAVSIGNPHAVIFVDDLTKVNIEQLGSLIERHSLFPDRVNVEFAQVNSPADITMRVWERGSGITKACGTGACATLAAAVTNGLSERKATLHLDGGDLLIEWDSDSGHIFMTGPATTVFTGRYTRQNIE